MTDYIREQPRQAWMGSWKWRVSIASSSLSVFVTLAATLSAATVCWHSFGLDLITHSFFGFGDEDVLVPSRRLDDDRRDGRLILLAMMIFMGVAVIAVTTIESLIYYFRVAATRKLLLAKPAGVGDFVSEMWGCCNDGSYCLLGLCCLAPRAADTASTVGVEPFWRVVLVIAFCDSMVAFSGLLPVLGNYVLGYLVFGAIRALFMASIRARVRGALGRDPNCNFCDFVLWYCCACCATIQEAKEVDAETRTKVIPCCCQLEPVDAAVNPTVMTVVGQPVYAAS
mmetsp:Transcript_28415/g.51673  ORF Transcript_28415/g.51673 Transcript_28415/m.51673 type:complete len:283 (+) Transcript_28415:79-927(+)